jgi:hypothetical protein
MQIMTEAQKKTFQSRYPNGVELNEDVISLLTEKSKQKQAITFDEVTLEDKPSDFHPNDVNLHSFVTRKISLKVIIQIQLRIIRLFLVFTCLGLWYSLSCNGHGHRRYLQISCFLKD